MGKNYAVEPAYIRNVLDGETKYVVPDYQRRYDWQEDKVENLCEDLLQEYFDDPECERQEYLLGPIVLLDKSNTMEVIDGQQRLVTITLLFCALRESVTQYSNGQSNDHYIQKIIKDINKSINLNSDNVIQLNNTRDDTIFRQICDGKTHDLKRSTIKRNYETILKFSKELCKKCGLDKPEAYQSGIDKIDHIINELKDKNSFVYMRVHNEDYSHQIFESLNSKGQQLKQADLIKSYILNIIPEHQRAPMRERWNKIVSGTNGKSIDPDQLIYTSILSRTFGSKNDVQRRELYKHVKKNYKEKKAVLTFVESLEQDADIIKKLENPESIRGINKQTLISFKHALYGLKQLRAIYFTRPMIAACREWRFDDPKTRKLAECLVKFFFVYRTICKSDIDLLRRNSKKMTEQIMNKNQLNVVLWTLLKYNTPDGERDHVDFDTFTKKFPEHVLDSQHEARYILTSFEHYLQKFRGLDIEDQSLNIEHIFPKNPSLEDWPNAEELQDYVDRLGNQTLISGTWNSTLSNHAFETKRRGIKTSKGIVVGYCQSGLKLNEYLKDRSQWTVKEIKDREEKLTQLAIKIWDLSEYSNNLKNLQQ